MKDAWIRRIERIHCMGMIAAACLVGLVASMIFWPQVFWTRWIPLFETARVDHVYCLDDLRHWTEVRTVVPVRQVKLKQLRQELAIQSASLDDWVFKVSADAATRKKQLRSVAESFHEQATRFGMAVELIRIEKNDPRPPNHDPNAEAGMELQWCPMTLRVEGTFAQACRFLHHSAECLPAQCRRLVWTRTTTSGDRDAGYETDLHEPRFQLELEFAIAIILDTPAVQDESVRENSEEGHRA